MKMQATSVSSSTSISYEPVKRLPSGPQRFPYVFLAKRTDGVEPKEIAIKKYQLPLEKEDQAEEIELLLKQALTLRNLQHENVLRHLNTQLCKATSLLEPDTYDVITEYCAGGTLENAITEDSVSPVLLQKWLGEIVAGLAYIHSRGIVHCNLKCENIFLSDPNFDLAVAKIGDFGCLKQLLDTEHKEVSHNKGTEPFMSPEMIQAYSRGVNIGPKTDIWSLGCVVIQMITGTIPKFYQEVNGKRVELDAQNTFHILYFVGNGGLPDIPVYLPEKLESFVKDCLQIDPTNRPEAADLLTHSFLAMDVSSVVLPIRA